MTARGTVVADQNWSFFGGASGAGFQSDFNVSGTSGNKTVSYHSTAWNHSVSRLSTAVKLVVVSVLTSSLDKVAGNRSSATPPRSSRQAGSAIKKPTGAGLGNFK
jgi:hypothetical protein